MSTNPHNHEFLEQCSEQCKSMDINLLKIETFAKRFSVDDDMKKESNCCVQLLDDNKYADRNDLTIRSTHPEESSEFEIETTPTLRIDNDCFIHVIDRECFKKQSLSMLTNNETSQARFQTTSDHKNISDPEPESKRVESTNISMR